MKNHEPAGLVIRYTEGDEARVVLLSTGEVDRANGLTSLADWVDANTLLVEVGDRVLLLLEQDDRVLTIPLENVKNIEYLPPVSTVAH